MINRVIIDNFATIEHISFDLGEGFNVITGETGAGKSVLVSAISIALGGRADISMIRTGSDKALIQIVGERDGEDVIISRELLSSGKSMSKLNGEMITLAKLKEFCADWVDIHGQYDNQQILNPDNHILITDRFRQDAIGGELALLKDKYDAYRKAKAAYDELLRTEQQAKQQKDFYQFEFNYINSLNLMPNEDEELSERFLIMRNSEKIYSAVSQARACLHEEDNSILARLNQITNELNSVSNYSDAITILSSQVQDVYYQLEDISDKLRDISSSLSFDEEDLDRVSQRLSTIEDAKRKYHKELSEIIDYMNELDEKLNLISNFDYEKDKLSKELAAKYAELEEQAELVSKIRHETAGILEQAIIKELKDLEFANSDFRIDIQRLDEIGPLGYDRLEFLISTNPGEPLMPMARIASGGEISRIMLAFKHIIGDFDQVETMIFDEIDTGISGRTALVVGNKMNEIASHHQLICITHLPQIAAYGDDNYLISKTVENNQSHTVIKHLDSEAKTIMIATLFSGNSSDNSIQAARELIEAVKRS